MHATGPSFRMWVSTRVAMLSVSLLCLRVLRALCGEGDIDTKQYDMQGSDGGDSSGSEAPSGRESPNEGDTDFEQRLVETVSRMASLLSSNTEETGGATPLEARRRSSLRSPVRPEGTVPSPGFLFHTFPPVPRPSPAQEVLVARALDPKHGQIYAHRGLVKASMDPAYTPRERLAMLLCLDNDCRAFARRQRVVFPRVTSSAWKTLARQSSPKCRPCRLLSGRRHRKL